MGSELGDTLAAGALLKEAVEDLEWSSGGLSVALLIKRNPPQITMTAQGLGELLIALPVSFLTLLWLACMIQHAATLGRCCTQ